MLPGAGYPWGAASAGATWQSLQSGQIRKQGAQGPPALVGGPQKPHIKLAAARADLRSHFYNLPTKAPQHACLWSVEDQEYQSFEVDHALFGNLHSTSAAAILSGALAGLPCVEIHLPAAMWFSISYPAATNSRTPVFTTKGQAFGAIGLEAEGEKEAIAAHGLLKPAGILGPTYPPIAGNGLQCAEAHYPEQKLTSPKLPWKLHKTR